MAIINKSTNNKSWRGCGERGTLSALLVGPQSKAVIVENSMELPQKIKKWIYLYFDPVIPLLGIYPKKPKTLI